MQEENSNRNDAYVLKIIQQRFPEQLKMLADNQIYLLDEDNYSSMLKQKSYFTYEQISQSSNPSIKKYRVFLSCFTLTIDAYIIPLGPLAKEYEQNIYPKYGTKYILFPIDQAQFQCAILKAVIFKFFRIFCLLPQPTSKDICKFDLIVDDKYQSIFIPSILFDLESFFETRKKTGTSEQLANLNNNQKIINYVVCQFMPILYFLEYLSIIDMISFVVFAEQQKLFNDPSQVEMEIKGEEKKQKYFVYISGLADAKSPQYYLQSEMMQLILNPSFNLLALYSIDPIFYNAKQTSQKMKSFQHDLLSTSFAFSLIEQLNSDKCGKNKQDCMMELYENKKFTRLTFKNQKLLANLLNVLHQQLDYDSFSLLRDRVIQLCFINSSIAQVELMAPLKNEDNNKSPLALSPCSKIELKKRRSYSESQKDKQVFLSLNANRFRDDHYFLLKEMKNQSYSSSQTEQWSDSDQRNRNYSEFKEQRELIKKKNQNNKDNDNEKEKEKDKYKKGGHGKQGNQQEITKQFQKRYSYLFKKRVFNEQKSKLKQRKINNSQKKNIKLNLKAEKSKDRVDFLFQDKKQNPLNILFYLKIKCELKQQEKPYNAIELTAQYAIIFLTLQAHLIIKFCQYFCILSNKSHQKHELNGTPLESQNAKDLELLHDLIILLIEIVAAKFVQMENTTNIDSFDSQIDFYALKYRKMTQIILLNLRFKVQSKQRTIKRLLELQGEFNSSVQRLLGRVKKQELYHQIKYRQFFDGVITSRNLLYQLENQDYYQHLDNLHSYIGRTVTLYRDTRELIDCVSKIMDNNSKAKSYTDIYFTNAGISCQICLKKSSLFLNLLLTDILCFACRFSAYSHIVFQTLTNLIKDGQILYNIYYNYAAKIFCNGLLYENYENPNSLKQSLLSKILFKNTLSELSIFKNILSWHKSCFFAYKYRAQESTLKLIKVQSVLSNLDFNKTSYFWLYNFTLLAIQNSKWSISDRFLYLLKRNMNFFSSPMLYYHSFIFQVKYYFGESALMRKGELKEGQMQLNKVKKSVNEQIEHLQIFQDLLDVIKSQMHFEAQLNPKIIFSLLHTTFKIFEFRQYKLEVEDICIEIVRRGNETKMKSVCMNVLNMMNQFIGSFKKFQEVSALLIEYGNRFLSEVESIYREEQIENNEQKVHMYQSIYQYTNNETTEYLKKYNQFYLYMWIISFFAEEDIFYFAKPAQLGSSKSKFRKKEIKNEMSSPIDISITQQLPFQSKPGQKSVQKFGKAEFYNYMNLLNTVCYLRILNGMICKNYGRGSEQISRYMNRYYRTMRQFKIEFCTLQSVYAKVFMEEKNIELEEAGDNKEDTQYMKEVYLKTRNDSYLLGFVKHIQFLIKTSSNQWIELVQRAFQNESVLQDEVIQNYLYYAVSNLPDGYENSLLQKIKQNNCFLFLSIEYLRAHKTTKQNYPTHLQLVKQINREFYFIKDVISATKKHAVFIKLPYLLTKVYKFFDVSKCIYFYHKYQRSLKYFDAHSIRNSVKFSIYHHLHKLTEDFGGARADFSKPSIKKSLLKNICSKCIHMFNRNLAPLRVSIYLSHKIQKLQYILQISENQKI